MKNLLYSFPKVRRLKERLERQKIRISILEDNLRQAQASLFYIHQIRERSPKFKTRFAEKNSDESALQFVERLREVTVNEQKLIDIEGDMWSTIRLGHLEVVNLLNTDPRAAMNYLDHMFSTPFTHGFRQGSESYRALLESEVQREHMNRVIMDRLCSLVEALGCMPVENPEQGNVGELMRSDPDDLIKMVCERLDANITGPIFAGGLYCLDAKNGLFSPHDFVDIYVAQRLREISSIENPRICEIGAGVGGVAYYANKLGIRDYTIIDLPTVNLAQAYFLYRNINGIEIKMADDIDPFSREDAIKILPPRFLEKAPHGRFDIVLNVDSMPEMLPSIALNYTKAIRDSSALFFSINQEAMAPNAGTLRQGRVMDYIDEIGGFERRIRAPFWIRKGYVEELYKIIK